MFDTNKVIKYFSDFFRKDKDSNLYKLIDICTGELKRVEETANLIQEWRDIDKAEGQVLDEIGGNVGQPRGQTNDDVYRILLKSKIARNLSDGTVDTIVRIIAIALSVDYSQIVIKEGWEDDPNNYAFIELFQLPLDSLLNTGIDPVSFATIIQRTVAAGVEVGTVRLDGTFEFSNYTDTDIQDTDKGLGDVNDPSVGGTLGAAFSSENVPPLPI